MKDNQKQFLNKKRKNINKKDSEDEEIISGSEVDFSKESAEEIDSQYEENFEQREDSGNFN